MKREQNQERPNILFIVTDHQRADSLGMVQCGVEVTPNLNRLASQGTVFSRAYNASPICVPARTALATGIYPTANGVVFNDWKGQRAGDHQPIHQYLSEGGYDVAHIGIDHIKVNPPIRQRVPFAKWIDNGDYAQYLANQGIDDTPPEGMDAYKRRVFEKQDGTRVEASYSNTHVNEWPFPSEHFKDSYFCQEATEFLQTRSTESPARPFALFLYLWAPHPPLRVPEPFASRFDPGQIELPANVNRPAQNEPTNRREGVPAQLAADVSLDQWRTVWAAHLGLVNLADEWIGRVLSTLESTGFNDNIVTAFMSDHGDHLGQHGLYQKMEMYEQAIRVPMVFCGPTILAQTIDSPVSHLDVVPTLLDFAGIAKPHTLDGRSLFPPLVDGEHLPATSIFCQYSGNPTVGDIRRAVITERYKYVYDPDDMAELYDLGNDPLEMENLAADPSHHDTVQALHAQCNAWALAHNDWIT
ncbi:MAG: sulfatase-like hydrolase/transferase [Chloroflexota bacterium]